MSSVTQIRVENVTPVQLVEQTRAGRIRIPPFQRSYKWTPRDVERLFDSILKRYPVGNLLLWERSAEAGRFVFGPLDLEVPGRSRARWVVDGQQRITSLVGAIAAPPEVSDPRFGVYVHLITRRVRATATPPGDGWLPIRVAGSTQALLAWQRAQADELDEKAVATADEVAASLREYPIPTYIVEADDERAVREVFDRMNGTGASLTRREAFDALHGTQDVASPGDLAEIAEAVERAGFGRLREDDVLRCLLALRGPDVFRDIRDEFTDDADRRAAFALTERTLLSVVAVLRTALCVPHARLIPYPSVLPMLAAFVHRFGVPTGRAETLVARWFWRGAALGNPAGSPPRVRSMLRGLATADDPQNAARALLAGLPERGAAWSGPDLAQTAMNRAMTRINIDGLVALGPLFLPTAGEEGGEAPALSVADLFESTPQPLVPLLPARDAGPWASTMANRLVHPPLDSATHALPAVLAADDRTRASHGIDSTCAQLLAADRWEAALSVRAELLRMEIEEFVDRFAEWGALDRPTAAELILGSG